MSIRMLPPLVLLLVGALVCGTVIGLVLLWPDGSSDAKLAGSLRPQTFAAEVTRVEPARCQNPEASDCKRVTAEVVEGRDRGRTASLTSGETFADPEFEVGDRIRLAKNELPPGTPASISPYTFVDFDRGAPMLWLVGVFCAIVVVFGRVRGVLALIGLGASVAVVALFVVPAILDGRPPLAVALVGSFAVMLATLSLAHGTSIKTVSAALGTAASLLLTAALALLFTELANITGLSSEEATLLQGSGGDLSLEGLVLAGIVIAALGVLDDLTVSQASAVLALRRANPAQTARELYRGGVGVGRDHVAATVNTLVLAYVGASLPVLLVFSVGDTPFVDAINFEAVAEQVIGTLVGSIGLIAAVPLTTAIASALAVRAPADAAAGSH